MNNRWLIILLLLQELVSFLLAVLFIGLLLAMISLLLMMFKEIYEVILAVI